MRHFPAARAVMAVSLAVMLIACSAGSSGPDGGGAAAPAPARGERPTLDPVSALYVLGDSLSDVGNAAAAADFLLDRNMRPPTVGLCNPADVIVLDRGCDELFYGRGRVSDGPVAVEHLARAVGVEALEPSMHVIPGRPVEGTNYAVASAKARARNPEDLESQIDWLALDHGPLDADALVVLIVGGNDALDALQAEVDASAPAPGAGREIVAASIEAIGAGVRRLLDIGARRLIVANVPDLSALPAVRLGARQRPDAAAVLERAAAITSSFDAALDAELDAIEASGAWDVPMPPRIVRFDLRAALAGARQAIAAGGGNADDACFDSEAYRASNLGERTFHPDCAPLSGGPPGFDTFAFWDGIHPTGVAHEFVGLAMADALARADEGS